MLRTSLKVAAVVGALAVIGTIEVAVIALEAGEAAVRRYGVGRLVLAWMVNS